MSSLTPPSIAVILCSSRQPRVCPQIAAFVTETIEHSLSSSSSSSSSPAEPPHPPPPRAKLELIDLAAWNLPLFDEPNIPSQITHHSEYCQPHTRAWSQEIQKHSAFIFVLPQYNWGYPAVVKNAIDYLYHEWHGKPAMIVSYGGHGGGKAAGQFRQVLQGVRMTVAETMPALSFPSKQTLRQATKGEELPLLGEEAIWRSAREIIVKSFEELMTLIAQDSGSKNG